MTSDFEGQAPSIVVFDVGEVLIDETRVWSVWADILGVSPLSFGAVLGAAIVQGLDYPDAFAELAPNIEWQSFSDEHERRYGGFREDDLYPDVRPCMDALRDHRIHVVIAGNQPAHRTAQLRALELPVTAIATSDDIGAEKPNPAFFTGVMDLAGSELASEVLYVGDRIDNDVLPAAAFGMRTCWLRRGPWGLLQDVPDPDTTSPGGADTDDTRGSSTHPEGQDTGSQDFHPDLVLEGLGELATLLLDWRRQSPPTP